MLSPVPYSSPELGTPLCRHRKRMGKATDAFSHKDKKNVAKPTKNPPMEHPIVKFSSVLWGCNESSFSEICRRGGWDTREKAVIGKQYFVRQAAILFGIAKATKDPKMSAALMDKAADLKSKVDGPGASLDLIPLAPDIEPPAT